MADWAYVAVGFAGSGAVVGGYALALALRIRRLRARPGDRRRP